MPDKPLSWVPKENILSYEELFLFIQAAIDEGVDKIRITGGEPTLRAGLDSFLTMITDYAPGIDLALTTNGFLMGEQAEKLAAAGLKRVNISLDSLKRDVAGRIANRDVLSDVLAGIEASQRAGLKVKLNMVPMRGINDGEIVDILEWAMARGVPLRYIEYMENDHANKHVKGMRSAEILAAIATKYPFEPVASQDSSSPAANYRLANGYAFGVIEPHLESFCENCNRIRLSAEGFLIPCLYFDEAMSIREKVQAGDVPGAVAVLKTVLAHKPEKNRWSSDSENESSDRAFYMTGG
jgi:cyclic pyranopterin phosphate synthase